MFSKTDMDYLRQDVSGFIVYQINYHDITIHSVVTGHDWIIISSYENSECTILHRHSRRDAYHRQRGRYGSLKEALEYILRHDGWFSSTKMKRGDEQEHLGLTRLQLFKEPE